MLPLARRRVGVPLPVAATAAVAAPFGMAVAVPRTRARDAAVYGLQMWAYVVMHELPYEDPERLERRALVDYPIRFDRAVFALRPHGRPPAARSRGPARPRPSTMRSCTRTGPGSSSRTSPRPGSCGAIRAGSLARRRMICAVFDIGLVGYFAVPTAPPWWAAEQGRIPGMRRIMVEVGRARLGAPLVASVRFPGR